MMLAIPAKTRFRRRIVNGLSVVAGALFIMGGIITLLPVFALHPLQSPLLLRDQWDVTTGFDKQLPASEGIPRDLRLNPEIVLWRSWPRPKASLESKLFKSDGPYIGIPVSGYSNNPGIRLYIEETESHKSIRIGHGAGREHWSTFIFRLPNAWKGRPLRLNARVDVTPSPDGMPYLGVGTPYLEHWTRYWLHSLPVFTFGFGMASCLLCALIAPVHFIVSRLGIRTFNLQCLTVIVAYSALSSTLFYYFYYFRLFALAAILSWVAIGALLCLRLLVRYSSRKKVPLTTQYPSLGLFLAIAFSSAGLLYAQDTCSDQFQANYRFEPAYWSVDNQLPLESAQHMVNGDLMDFVESHWSGYKVSDRPHLFACMLSPMAALIKLIPAWEDEFRFAFLLFTSFGVLVMSAWVFPAWFLLREARVSRNLIGAIIILTSCSPFVFFNTIYIWPKLLSSTLALICYCCLRNARRVSDRAALFYILAGTAGGLAMLSHGGIFFSLTALGLWILLFPAQRRFSLHWFSASLAFASIMFPWMAWVKYVDPPGDVLAKGALAGGWGFGTKADEASLFEAIVHRYQNTTLSEIWQLKRNAFGAWLGGSFDPMHVDAMIPLVSGIPVRLGFIRFYQFMYIIPVVEIVWLCLVLLGYISWKNKIPANQRLRRLLLEMLFISVIGLLVQLTLLWDVHIVPTYGYLTMFLLVFTGIAALPLFETILRLSIVVLHAGLFVVIWIFQPFAAYGNCNLTIAIPVVTLWAYMIGSAIMAIHAGTHTRALLPADRGLSSRV